MTATTRGLINTNKICEWLGEFGQSANQAVNPCFGGEGCGESRREEAGGRGLRRGKPSLNPHSVRPSPHTHSGWEAGLGVSVPVRSFPGPRLCTGTTQRNHAPQGLLASNSAQNRRPGPAVSLVCAKAGGVTAMGRSPGECGRLPGGGVPADPRSVSRNRPAALGRG